MSMYTMTVNEILINYLSPIEETCLSALVSKTKEKYFSFDYPWYNEIQSSKDEFEQLFLEHFMPYEIGQETLGKHKLMLKNKLSIIMPYYKNLWNAMHIDMDWNKNVDMQYKEIENNKQTTDTTHSAHSQSESVKNEGIETKENVTTTNEVIGESTGNTTGDENTDENSNTQSIDSDNPQINFSGTDYASRMNRGQTESTRSRTSTDTTKVNSTETTNGAQDKSVTNTATHNDTNETTSSGNSTTNDSQNRDTIRTESGNRGMTRLEVFEQMRDAFVNINQQIILDCESLFMQVL